MEALENVEVVRLRLEGQLAEAKSACNKLDKGATYTIMRDVVVLLEEVLEFQETSVRRPRGSFS
jgi:hypothetical protein